jgi:hypothetical protein
MPRLNLTNKFVRSVRPTGSRQEFSDAIVPQLMLRIGERGAKSWALLARYPGYKIRPGAPSGRYFLANGWLPSIPISTIATARH